MRERLFAIDAVRGWVMIFMALDHAMYFNYTHIVAEGYQGMRPEILPDIVHFITRFITHYCAPTFIFLAGFSVALYGTRRSFHLSEAQITSKLLIRGCILLVLQIALVNWVWGFGSFQHLTSGYAVTYFGILACIGCGIIILAWVRRIPPSLLATSSILILLMIPFLLEWLPLLPENESVLLEIFLQPNTSGWLFVNYPLLPWIGVLGLGCACGVWIVEHPGKITRLFYIMGIIFLAIWVIVRLGGGYGNLIAYQGEGIRDFMLMSKYPPSLVFLLWNLGGMSIALAGHSHLENHLHTVFPMKIIVSIGQVPLFFYIVHLYVYRMLSWTPLGGSLIMGYIAWIVGLCVMIPLCYGYRSLKQNNPHSILQYL
ncbi:MAG: DUF1624 domain-containing protein [Theionarchaea archaeon]|nr:DUF1624 domain-containing protein [Theionarchaea archaeon]